MHRLDNQTVGDAAGPARAAGCSRSQHRRASHLASSFRLRLERRDAVTRLLVHVALVFRTHKTRRAAAGWGRHDRAPSSAAMPPLAALSQRPSDMDPDKTVGGGR